MSILRYLQGNFDEVIFTNGADVRVNCPFCHDAKAHMYVSTVKPVAHCFKCDWSGTWYGFIKDYSGASTAAEVYALLKEPPQTVMDFSAVVGRYEHRREQRQRIIKQEMPYWYRPLTGGNLNCLGGGILTYARRRLSEYKIIRYGLGYCSDPEQPYVHRLIIPVERGYFQARSITPTGKPKYVNPPMPIDDRLFNAQALVDNREVFIAEGAISAMALGDNAVATLGKKATKEQLRRLGKSDVDRFIIAYDAGTELSQPVFEIADWLQACGKVVIIRSYLDGDPDDGITWSDWEYNLMYKLSGKMSLF